MDDLDLPTPPADPCAIQHLWATVSNVRASAGWCIWCGTGAGDPAFMLLGLGDKMPGQVECVTIPDQPLIGKPEVHWI